MAQSTFSRESQAVLPKYAFSPAPEGDATCREELLRPCALATLKRQEALMAQIERLASTGGFCWDAATDEMMCTPEVYRILEVDAETPISLRLLGTRIHPEDLPLLDEMLGRARSGVVGFEYQLRLRLLHRSVKYLQLNARRSDGAAAQTQYIGAIQDITQRRLSDDALGNMRSELARVARVSTLGALAASIAHEVNQPLSGIMTNASTCLEMLGAQSPDLDGARDTAKRTIRDCERACDVIARLRALFGKNRGKTESVDLNRVTTEVIALSLGEFRRRRVLLHTELADGLAVVTGDRVQLQQVVLNLLLNAAEAMSGVEDRTRRLLIRTEPEHGDRVRLSVQDTGVGFHPEDAERIFEAFYTTKSGGMGIGLSVSRSIIESHQGRLWAQLNAGAGATFIFSIPTRQNS
jgi:C4-dicarboxylate-specific signal transduction histidine kinase